MRGKLMEATLNLIYTMNLVPPKDLGTIVHPNVVHSKHYSLKILALCIMALFAFVYNFFISLYKHLEH